MCRYYGLRRGVFFFMDELEIWKPIPRYIGLYEVSSLSRVRSLDRIVVVRGHPMMASKTLRGKILKKWIAQVGYWMVSLGRDGKLTQYYVHRLVAEAFIQNPSNLPNIDHKDGDKTNDNFTNLEWVTQPENMSRARIACIEKTGRAMAKCKLKPEEVLLIRELIQSSSSRELGLRFGVSYATIEDAVARRTWKHLPSPEPH